MLAKTKSLIALADCNNFFVSCERLYRPDLWHKPVAVLSNNDGCIISRSAEVKAMGIGMAEPYFKLAPLLKKNGVVILSGNHQLYREISDKVMQVLSRYTDLMEVYSIDEAFLSFSIRSIEDPVEYSRNIRASVARMIGIPLSIGISPTKTLSKLAGEVAKKKTAAGVFRITEENAPDILDTTPIEDIWGIGWRNSGKLHRAGIHTAGDLARKDSVWVKKQLTVLGLMTQLELQGQPCIPITTAVKPPQTIQVSHSFGEPLRTIKEIEPAMVEHALRAASQMREAKVAAKSIKAYLLRGFISGEHRFLSVYRLLGDPICNDPEIIQHALSLLRQIFDENHSQGDFYMKGCLVFADLSESVYRQTSLFDDRHRQRTKYDRVGMVTDLINDRLGKRVIYPATLVSKEKRWKPQGKLRSRGELVIS